MEGYLGEIRLFAGTYAPVGWAFCDGSTLQINQYNALYALLGTLYGGDGVSSFKLPDLRGRVVVSQKQNYPLGGSGGVETVTLTESTMATHQHGMNASTASGNSTSPTGTILAAPVDPTSFGKTINVYVPASAPNLTKQTFPADTLTPSGGNQPHENRMPYVAINYIIALQGIYPTSN